MELKGQMETLADWVTQKRLEMSASGKIDDGTEAILEHVELTLHGFQGLAANAVGGIAGVIGDAFAQYENFLDEVSKIRGEASARTSQIEQKLKSADSTADFDKLQKEIEQIRTKTEEKISQLAKNVSLPIPVTLHKLSFTEKCPVCDAANTFEMPDRVGETAVVICKRCGKGFNAHLVSPQSVLTRKLGKVYSANFKSEFGTTGETFPAVMNALRVTQAWIPPDALEFLFKAAVRAHQNLKRTNQPPSADSLQDAAFEEVSRSNQQISKIAIRQFFKLVFLGRAFKFAEGVPPKFKSSYCNEIDERALQVSFVNQSVYRLLNSMQLRAENATDVTRAIFGSSSADKEELVKQTILERTAQHAKQLFEMGKTGVDEIEKKS